MAPELMVAETDQTERIEPLTNGTAIPSERVDSTEPIAIVGMACRWPGDPTTGEDIDSPEALWDFLQQKRHAYSEFPTHRINIDAWFHPQANRPGSFYTRGGAFLKADPRRFDPSFFGINPQEAASVDPAQRKFLEVVYEAFESGGVPLDRISGSKTGCFVGNFNYDHQLMQYRDTEYPEPYGITGGGIALLSNRVSYVFNLHGPSMTLDTACSSSMYALHLACTSIQSGECDAAVVGGSNMILTPECQVFSSSLGAVSKTSRCHTFDAAADGYARADGIGALYVKSLKQALSDNDPIRAIIRGTAINANGKTSGITHPDPSGQENAIRRAYERAGISDFSLTSYFECHGTGTPVGDPLEVEAVGRVFSKGRAEGKPLLIGSIKSNLGHCEPASGIAGIMKSVLALERGVVPPIQNLKRVNPNLDLRSGSLKIVQESTPWPDGPVRRASVNSFGYGGANAHTILDAIENLAPGRGGARKAREAATKDSTEGRKDDYSNSHTTHDLDSLTNGHSKNLHFSQRQFFLLPFSAHNERTLEKNIEALSLCANQWSLLDLSYTLGCRRSLFSNRSFIVVNAGQAEKSLQTPDMAFYKCLGSSEVSLGFVFTGQGAQWPQMGLELMNSFPKFLSSIRDMDGVLGTLRNSPRWRIEDCIRAGPETSPVYSAELSQPLVTAVQVALIDLLASWNIQSTANVGHSSGEIAAAYASGCITAAEAILSAYARGRAVARNTRNGAMLAVGLGVDDIKARLSSLDNIEIACYNSPESVTLSGDAADILALDKSLAAERIFARVLMTGGNAYHSRHMNSLGEGYEQDLNDMISSLSDLPSNVLPWSELFSSKNGEIYPKQRIRSAYWRGNLESPVLFDQAVTSLIETSPVDFLVEIGPHPALKGPIRQISKSMPNVKFPEHIATLERGKDAAESLLRTAGFLFAKGYKVAMERVNAIEALDITTNRIFKTESGTAIVDLPNYQWQYEELLYVENRWTREWRLRSHPRHDILGSRNPGGNKNEPSWRNVLRQKDLPWLPDHKIGDDTVFPASAYLCMAIEAVIQTIEVKGNDASGITKFNFQDIYLETALLVPESSSVEVLFSLRPAKLNPKIYHESLYDFTVTSVGKLDDSDVFTEHCHGQVGFEFRTTIDSRQEQITDLGFQKKISASRWYDAFRRVGLCYGPTFQGLSDIKAHGDSKTVESQVQMAPTRGLMMQESRYLLHPAALDSVLQLAIIAAHGGRHSGLETGYLPVFLKQMSVWPNKGTKESAFARAKSQSADARTITADIAMNSSEGTPILSASYIRLVQSESSVMSFTNNDVAPFTRMEWKPDIDLLNTCSSSKIFPSVANELGDAELSTLDVLALHQIIQFHTQYSEIFDHGSQTPHLQRFLDWMTAKVEQAQGGDFKGAIEILNLTISERDQEIARLFSSLMEKNGPETRLMAHMYESLPAIYRGEIAGIEAAVQDHLLDDMYEYMTLYHDGSIALKDVVVLLSHKLPSLKILEVGGGTGSATREVLPALKGNSQYRGYDSYTFSDIGPAFLANAQQRFKDFKAVIYKPFDMQTDAGHQGFDSDFDLVIASNVIHATTNIRETLKNIRLLLKPGGKLVLFEFVQPRLSWNMILGTFSDFWNGDVDPNFPRTEGPFLKRATWNEVLPLTGYRGVDMMLDHFTQHGEAAIIVATTKDSATRIPPVVQPSENLYCIYRENVSPFISDCVNYFRAVGFSVGLVALTSTFHLNKERVVSLVEADRPFFLDVSGTEWEAAKQLMLHSRSILWVTRGSLLTGDHPEYALVSGIACAIHTEDISSRLVIADFDRDELSLAQNLEALVQLEHRGTTYVAGDDFEFRLKSGVVHISRLAPDEALNANARAKLDTRAKTQLVPLVDLRGKALTLASEKTGAASTVYFEESAALFEPLEDDCVQIEVEAFGLNAKTIRNLESGSSTGSCSNGCAGVITRIGAKVTNLTAGDRVICLCPLRVSTHVQTKAIFCQVLQEREKFESIAAVLDAICTAIYSLLRLANLAKGETVLIFSAVSAIGQSACQIARSCQANVYAIVESNEARRELSEQSSGIPESQIFVTDDQGFTNEILRQTGGRRVDAMLSCSVNDCSHKYWGCLAPFGRIVEVGGDEPTDAPDISVSSLPRGATFVSFDLELLGQTQPIAVSRLMAEAKKLYSEGVFGSTESKVFPVAHVEKAVSEIAREKALVLSYANKEQEIKFRRLPFSSRFIPDASYLLVGCLGGLGRSFAYWMVKRGARNLIFLSRSGLSNQVTKKFVSDLERLQVNVIVVQGDVTKMTDVQNAVDAGSGRIKGIVQAPLVLHDAFFRNMTLEGFNATMQPRVIGTMNLHRALQKNPLDFFMLWSSWTTLLGSASQSSYMASNSFMDAFGRHRQALGMPATSLSLGQILDIGIVSHTPEYQENLHPVATSLASQPDVVYTNGHLLAGMAHSGLSLQSDRYPIGEMSWRYDPRFSLLISAVERSASDSRNTVVLVADDDPAESLLDRIHKRVGRLLYMAKEDIHVTQPMTSYGIDSMVAAELRNWLFSVSKVDVSLLNMLHPSMTIEKLAKLAAQGEQDAQKG